jgi:predicted RNase H-like HicB family nuclease
MELPLAIHKDRNSVYGVTIPDVPGCYSWRDTIDDAVKNAKEAIYSHFEVTVAEGGDIDVSVSKIENLIEAEEFKGAIWVLVM